MRAHLDKHKLRELIGGRFPDADITVDGGDGKYTAVIVCGRFAGLSTVKRHQMVYAAVDGEIKSGALHALSIKARAPGETPGE